MATVEEQLAQLASRVPGARAEPLPSGTRLVTLPDVLLPEGWNKRSTTVRFLIQPTYPFAQPDCFWVDADLRLAGGGLPQNTGYNPMPEVPAANWLWFSWHLLQAWNPNRDTLSSWYNVILERFRRLS